jgi:2-methylcitrate dehydratase PrpD
MSVRRGTRSLVEDGYRVALLDWLACAAGGVGERAARAARGGEDAPARALWLGTAGHVLDFDDTWMPGVAHLSAPTAPAALAVAAGTGATVAELLSAYATGFEAMGALAGAGHPALYDRGYHPTAVCGALGAAVAAAELLGLEGEARASAERLALLQAGGLRAAFGTDGKALQVGLASAAGVMAAQAAARGATIGADVAGGPAGYEAAFGVRWVGADDRPPAVAENWIKPWPCCLFTHGAVEAAASLREDGPPADVVVTVHPRARRAAAYDDVTSGLEAKFSFPYLVALTLLRGEPRVRDLADVDEEVRAWASAHVRVVCDEALGETEAIVGDAHVRHSLGSPQRPMPEDRLREKAHELAGARLDGVLDDPGAPAADVLDAVAQSIASQT